MELKYSIQRAAVIVGILALVSITAVAQENRSEISVQGTGFFTKDTDGNGIQQHATDTGGFLLGIVTVSIAGSQPRRTTAMIATHNFISAAHRPASRLTSTNSLAQRW
jgi:hypothetical protein